MKLHEKLRAGKTVFGLFCELACADSVELAGIAGWDFVVVDCEHSSIAMSALPEFIRAGECGGVPVIVRVEDNFPALIQHALDYGAAGVQIPQIASGEAAGKAVRSSRFHPMGERGFNPFVRASRFSDVPVSEFLRRSNEEVLVVLQVESAAGLAAIDSIAGHVGLDVIFIGPYDLSQSLGIPGDVGNELVFRAGAEIVARAEALGKAVGVFVNSADAASRWMDAGVRYICYSVDSVLLLKAMRTALGEVRAFAATPQI
jgi:4-hydroxy-2-oxoheptanedioate aldolase